MMRVVTPASLSRVISVGRISATDAASVRTSDCVGGIGYSASIGAGRLRFLNCAMK